MEGVFCPSLEGCDDVVQRSSRVLHVMAVPVGCCRSGRQPIAIRKTGSGRHQPHRFVMLIIAGQRSVSDRQESEKVTAVTGRDLEAMCLL